LINLVRGEMALFGPQPVRAAFAEYLDRLTPVFSRRLSVKPGIFGWAQSHCGPVPTDDCAIAGQVQNETLRIGYDLYYLEYGSPLMDLEILARTLLRPFLASRSR
jgi:lipopolysaccharide/colanic/teichoic acid biosynthesis glycosyltransferase